MQGSSRASLAIGRERLDAAERILTQLTKMAKAA